MFALRTCRGLSALLAALVVATPLAAQDSSLANEIERLRRDMNTLQSYVFRGDKKAIGPTTGGGSMAGFASQDAVSNLQIQVQELRRRMREVNGTFEEIDHRIARLSERFDKLVADVDQRLRALESGRTSQNGASQVGRAAGGPDRSGDTTASRSDGTASAADGGSESGLQPGQKPFATLSQNDMSRYRKTGEKAPSPQAAPASPPVSTSSADGASQTAALPGGTPKEQYDHAYNLLLRRDLPNAEAALKAFVDTHPKHELADNAIFWLGETFYARKQYEDAIRVYYDAYRTYPEGNKAPDVLLKLGMSLKSIGEKDSACSAFEKLTSSHPKASPRILDTAKRERQSLGCQ